MYVVKTGDLQILDGNYVYETVSAGGIVGEMAMVDGSPRSATVCAIKRSTVIPIDERRFLFMVQQTPFFALRVMRVMTARLRAPAVTERGRGKTILNAVIGSTPRETCAHLPSRALEARSNSGSRRRRATSCG